MSTIAMGIFECQVTAQVAAIIPATATTHSADPNGALCLSILMQRSSVKITPIPEITHPNEELK